MRSTIMSFSLARRLKPVTKLGHGPFSSSSRLGVSIICFAIIFSPRKFEVPAQQTAQRYIQYLIGWAAAPPSISWVNHLPHCGRATPTHMGDGDFPHTGM